MSKTTKKYRYCVFYASTEDIGWTDLFLKEPINSGDIVAHLENMIAEEKGLTNVSITNFQLLNGIVMVNQVNGQFK